jgi:hypothetical protein
MAMLVLDKDTIQSIDKWRPADGLQSQMVRLPVGFIMATLKEDSRETELLKVGGAVILVFVTFLSHARIYESQR